MTERNDRHTNAATGLRRDTASSNSRKGEEIKMARVKIVRAVDRDELYEEFKRLMQQDKRDAETQEEKDAYDYAVLRLQNILY